jgi:rhodanese-related sulfurtransferase
MNRTITPSELRDLMRAKKDVAIIDVRRQSDFDADKEMIPGAIRRDPEKVTEWAQELPKDREIIIYCAHGGSVSNAVLDKLLEEKLNARYIEEGLAAWKESSRKTV